MEGPMSSATLSAVAALMLALAGCGSFASNSDVPAGIYTGLEGRPKVADSPTVTIVDSAGARPDGGTDVQGTSCKNKIWEPEPSEENAVALMKRQAVDMGMNVIYVIGIGGDPAAVLKNCWSAITATGKAFKERQSSGGDVQPRATRR
jgi:hypothetical protein